MVDQSSLKTYRVVIADDNYAHRIKDAIENVWKCHDVEDRLSFEYEFEIVDDRNPELARDKVLAIYRQKGGPFAYIQDCHYEVDVGVPKETAGLTIVLESICRYYRSMNTIEAWPWTHAIIVSRFLGPFDQGRARENVIDAIGPDGRYRVPDDRRHKFAVSLSSKDSSLTELGEALLTLAKKECVTRRGRCDCLKMPALH